METEPSVRVLRKKKKELLHDACSNPGAQSLGKGNINTRKVEKRSKIPLLRDKRSNFKYAKLKNTVNKKTKNRQAVMPYAPGQCS